MQCASGSWGRRGPAPGEVSAQAHVALCFCFVTRSCTPRWALLSSTFLLGLLRIRMLWAKWAAGRCFIKLTCSLLLHSAMGDNSPSGSWKMTAHPLGKCQAGQPAGCERASLKAVPTLHRGQEVRLRARDLLLECPIMCPPLEVKAEAGTLCCEGC